MTCSCALIALAAVLSLPLAALAQPAGSRPEWETFSDTWAATDALGLKHPPATIDFKWADNIQQTATGARAKLGCRG